MDAELKPCPFCGKPVRLYESGYYGAPVIEHAMQGEECAFIKLVYYGQRLAQAREKWNRRTP